MEIKRDTAIQTKQIQSSEPASTQKVAENKGSQGTSQVQDKFENAQVQNTSTTQAVKSRAVTPQEEKTIRNFYEEGWNKADKSVLDAHPKIAQQCAQQLDQYKQTFPDLRINVNSMERHSEEVWVRWSAQGTRANEGSSVQEHVDGLTRMKINDGEIVSAKASWNDRALQQRLSNKIVG
jgi:hypothetical protein